jgi:hypothetical protein
VECTWKENMLMHHVTTNGEKTKCTRFANPMGGCKHKLLLLLLLLLLLIGGSI